MLNLNVCYCLSKYPSQLSQGAGAYLSKIPLLQLCWNKYKYFRKTSCLFSIFPTKVLQKKSTDSDNMVFKNVCWSHFITDQFIDHLKIIKALVFAIEWTHWSTINFAIKICLFSTVDAPTEFSAFYLILVDLFDHH